MSKIMPTMLCRYQGKKIISKRHASIIYKHYNIIIKSIDTSKYNYKNEYNTITQLYNKNIIKLLDSYYENDRFNLIYPYYECGDLYNYLLKIHYDSAKPPSNITLVHLFKNLVEPIKYLHSKSYVHLDVKPENFLIKKNENSKNLSINSISNKYNNNLVLIDYEFARYIQGNYNNIHDLKYICGTNNYMAPEMKNRRFGFPSDIYSLGRIFFLLQFKRLPNKNDILIQSELKQFPDLKDITISLLNSNPKNRPTIFEVDKLLDIYIENILT